MPDSVGHRTDHVDPWNEGLSPRAASRDAQTQLEHLFSSVKAFTAGTAQNDDITVLVVSYRGVAD